MFICLIGNNILLILTRLLMRNVCLIDFEDELANNEKYITDTVVVLYLGKW